MNLLIKLSKVSLLLATIMYLYEGQAKAEQVWQVRDAGIETLNNDGINEYRITNGFLDAIDTDFKNGIIEFELKPTRHRAFFYVYFRQQGAKAAKQSEAIYVRTHKPNAPDTIQYSPVFQGKSAWQLYYGESGTAPANWDLDAWTKVKIEIIGDTFSMWVGDNNKPNIDKMRLMGATKHGGLSFRGFIPRGSKAQYTASIRNIKITPFAQQQKGVLQAQASDNVKTSPKQHAINQYRVSEAFAVPTKSETQIPAAILAQPWKTVKTHANGLLEILRHRKIPKDARIWAVATKVTLRSNQAKVCQINLGFSDALTLFLNGNPQFFADASYRYRGNRQEGILHPEQATIFLNLKKGENTLNMIVADSFGGWGLQTHLLNCEGVDIL